jgi:hypothetical protein
MKDQLMSLIPHIKVLNIILDLDDNTNLKMLRLFPNVEDFIFL